MHKVKVADEFPRQIPEQYSRFRQNYRNTHIKHLTSWQTVMEDSDRRKSLTLTLFSTNVGWPVEIKEFHGAMIVLQALWRYPVVRDRLNKLGGSCWPLAAVKNLG